MTDYVAYKGGFLYQTAEDCITHVNIHPQQDIDLGGMILLNIHGKLTIKTYYAWDGPSGPCKWLSTCAPWPVCALYKKFLLPPLMRPSIIHDAIYQLIRNDKLAQDYKDIADGIFRDEVARDHKRRGWPEWFGNTRAKWCFWGVQKGGHSATVPSGRKRLYYAP